MNRPDCLYIVIPCYNEEQVLPVTSGMFLDELNHLIKERQKARNQVRKYKTKEQKDEQKLIAKSYTPEIGKLRKELMYCQKIEERSLGINKFLNEHEKQKRRKERTR